MGAGVWSNGGIQTSTSRLAENTFGSWAEYELISNQTINSMASASGYNQGSSSNSYDKIAKLTPRTDSQLGNYSGGWNGSSSELIDNFKARYEGSATSGWDYSKVSSDGKITAFRAASGVNLGGITLNNGQSVVVFIDGDVTITDNIISDLGNATSAMNIPQMVIVASGNINVKNNVTQIDAWLLTQKDLKTCDIVKDSVNQNSCGNSLKINGPIVANNIKSWRTSGSGSDYSQPAEIYNLRSDAYLWADAHSSGEGKIITTRTNELPVRF